VKRVEHDHGESDRLIVYYRDKNVVILIRTSRPDCFGLNGTPIWLVKTIEDRIAQYLAERLEDGLPGAERELDDGVEVSRLQRADLGLGAHVVQTLAAIAQGSVCGGQPTRRPQSSHMTAYFFMPAGVTAI
jgi:hypothetical protein